MKTGVKTESKFIVKPENKVVICTMKVEVQIYGPKWWNIDPKCWETKAPMVNELGEFTVKAKARCNSKDTFDESIGKKIAESRAKAKAFKIASNVWNCIAKDFNNNNNIALKLAMSCDTVQGIETEHVEKLLEDYQNDNKFK